jgi:hypothetical protein
MIELEFVLKLLQSSDSEQRLYHILYQSRLPAVIESLDSSILPNLEPRFSDLQVCILIRMLLIQSLHRIKWHDQYYIRQSNQRRYKHKTQVIESGIIRGVVISSCDLFELVIRVQETHPRDYLSDEHTLQPGEKGTCNMTSIALQELNHTNILLFCLQNQLQSLKWTDQERVNCS